MICKKFFLINNYASLQPQSTKIWVLGKYLANLCTFKPQLKKRQC